MIFYPAVLLRLDMQSKGALQLTKNSGLQCKFSAISGKEGNLVELHVRLNFQNFLIQKFCTI